MSESSQAKEPAEKNELKAGYSRRKYKKLLIITAALIAVIIGAFAAVRGYQYAVTPASIRQPSVDHYHFRTQLFYDGQPVNFAEEQFQETYVGGQCSADLPETPIHFHDNVDQMTHIHWNGMTGGMVLKYYGLNLIGGPDGKLGYRFDRGYIDPQAIDIRSDSLPDIPKGHKVYVFIKTDDGFKEKSITEFTEQDLELFFEKQSNLGVAPQGWLGKLFPKVSAHAGEDHSVQIEGQAETQAEGVDLQRLNNLIGDVAIYIQPERPSDEQVTEAFNNLIDLPESTCGG